MARERAEPECVEICALGRARDVSRVWVWVWVGVGVWVWVCGCVCARARCGGAGLVTIHVSIAIRNLALRKASADFQRWITDKDERNQLEFGAANALKFLIDVCERQLPPNNDNKVLEHVLNAPIALL